MLIGPTITLEVLEKHMSDKHYENKMELGKLRRMQQSIAEEIKTLPAKVMTNQDGVDVEIPNPALQTAPAKLREVEQLLQATQDQQVFIEAKLKELGAVEGQAKSRGVVFNKAEKKITLSLRDCVNFGIEPEELASPTV